MLTKKDIEKIVNDAIAKHMRARTTELQAIRKSIERIAPLTPATAAAPTLLRQPLTIARAVDAAIASTPTAGPREREQLAMQLLQAQHAQPRPIRY
jgi:hypothetical protein